MNNELSTLTVRAFCLLLPFSTYNLCEIGFSAVAALIKFSAKERKRTQSDNVDYITLLSIMLLSERAPRKTLFII